MPKLKIYFACSIRGGGDTSSYQAIVEAIKSTGAICLSEVFVNDAIHLGGSPLPEKDIYQRDISWIQECDALIAEVTNPSLGVGYELAYAESLQKPVFTLYNIGSGSRLSAMIGGNAYFENGSYQSADDIPPLITSFIATLPHA